MGFNLFLTQPLPNKTFKRKNWQIFVSFSFPSSYYYIIEIIMWNEMPWKWWWRGIVAAKEIGPPHPQPW